MTSKGLLVLSLLGCFGCGGPTSTLGLDGGTDGEVDASPDAEVLCTLDPSNVHPIAAEVCDGVDNDCDGVVDDGVAHLRALRYRDLDGDGYGSESMPVPDACPADGLVLPGTAFDCDDEDPNVHPQRLDDCATQQDLDCDGVFSPVSVVPPSNAWIQDPVDLAALFTQSGPTDPPADVILQPIGQVRIDLCPGTYRVLLDLGGDGLGLSNDFVVVGHGASPEDVVLDAAGAGGNATVRRWWNLDQGGGSSARFENLTLANGAASDAGGCIHHAAGETTGVLALDRVVLSGCRAPRGGAIAVQSGMRFTATDVRFLDASATVAGGAIDFAGLSFEMHGGSFVNASAPASSGSAIAATLAGSATFDLANVDFDAPPDDVAIQIGNTTTLRDLGSAATLHCDVATGCTP